MNIINPKGNKGRLPIQLLKLADKDFKETI